MGTLFTVKCEKCGCCRELFAGGGLNDCMPLKFMKELPENEQKALDKAITDGAKQISINRIISVCGCGEIYARPLVKYILNGKEYELSGNCPKCSSKKSRTAENNEYCPECKNRITIKKSGLWD